MTQTKILVIYGSSHSETEHRAFMSAITALTDLVGVHLIVVREGQSADAILDRCALSDRDAVDSTTQIRDGLRRCSEARKSYWLHQLSTGVLRVELGDAASSHVLSRSMAGRPTHFSEESKAAMRLIETMMDSGDLALVPDRFIEGRMRFTGAPVREVDKPSAPVESVTAIQGEAMSFMLDPLEQAIESTAYLIREERRSAVEDLDPSDKAPTLVYKSLSQHLDALLAIQIKRVTADETV